MSGSDAASVLGGKQYREAVCGQDRAHGSRALGPRRIRLRLGQCALQPHAACAMYLPKPGGVVGKGKGLAQGLAVSADHLWHVAYMISEVQRCEGGLAMPAEAGGTARMNARGGRPVRGDPEVAHVVFLRQSNRTVRKNQPLDVRGAEAQPQPASWGASPQGPSSTSPSQS